MNILEMTPQQLREAADLKEQIEKLNQELIGILGESSDGAAAPAKNGHSPRNGKLHWTQTPAGRLKCARNSKRFWAGKIKK
jgi:hypothetical protein